MTSFAVPFNRPPRAANSLDYLRQVLESGHESGDGPFTKLASSRLSSHLGGSHVLLTTSCTHALEMAALLADLEPGDEVIVPSFTFVSTASAFALRGARIRFADVDPRTLNICPSSVETLVSAKTKAICIVHYGGVACDIDRLIAISTKVGCHLIEDNAHGLFGSWRGQPLGTYGALATQSFHETKNVSTGEGGALVINDRSLLERAEIIREKGTNRSRFFRGQVDKYSWVELGSSYLPSEATAALLAAQLEQAHQFQARRQQIWNIYDTELADWASTRRTQRPWIPDGCAHPAHLYFLLLPDLEARGRFIAHLRSQGVLAVFHYLPLHLSEYGQRFGGRPGDCPVTESSSDRLVRLPLFADMGEEQVERVLEGVKSFSP